MILTIYRLNVKSEDGKTLYKIRDKSNGQWLSNEERKQICKDLSERFSSFELEATIPIVFKLNEAEDAAAFYMLWCALDGEIELCEDI
jgi:hypothetical protein